MKEKVNALVAKVNTCIMINFIILTLYEILNLFSLLNSHIEHLKSMIVVLLL